MEPIRILTVGGDASLWIGLSSTLGNSASQIYVPREVDPANLGAAALNVDVIVIVVPREGDFRLDGVTALKEAGVARRSIALIDAPDPDAAAFAVGCGFAGCVDRGATAEHLAAAVRQVADNGLFFDGSAAGEIRTRLRTLEEALDRPAMAAARALASALELKDTYTGGHAERVTALAMRLARAAMLEDALPTEALEAAFLLHDVGKIGIPESILNKPSGLTDTERRVLQTHPILGERIVAPLGFPRVVADVIRHHHERWDGHGYPDGLSGTDIPAAARLFSIADVLDAMTSVRPYRKPVNFRAAVKEIMLHAGHQFDPVLCAILEETFLEQPVDLFSDGLSLN